MSTFFPRFMSLAVLSLMPLAAACGPELEHEEPTPLELEETDSQQSSLILGANRFGLVTGGIYASGDQPLSDPTSRSKFFCEMQQLGTRWLRLEADWPNVQPETYKQIVADAHARGIKVIALYTFKPFCGNKDSAFDRDTYINEYLNKVKSWSTNVFEGTYNGQSVRADAIEVMNEPNMEVPAPGEVGCPDGVKRFRVEPNTFAWAVRRVKEWKQASGRTELIISGGTLNTYTNESFWPALFASGALRNYPGNPPWDVFGVHPYNTFSYNKTCINNLGAGCFGSTTAGWKYATRTTLQDIRTKLNSATGVSTTRLFVTEFGWQNVGVADGRVNSVKTEAQVAEGMRVAAEAFGDSGAVDYALWYNYRNHADFSGPWGLRTHFNGSTHYPSKWEPWHEFQKLAKGLTARTADSPDLCWR